MDLTKLGIFFGIPLLAFNGCLNLGCANFLKNTSNDITESMKLASAAAVAQIKESGVLTNYQNNLSGDLHNPGVVIENGLVWRTKIAFDGVHGEVDVATHGTGTQLPPGVKDELVKQLAQPISDEQRTAILNIMGWNRTQPTP